MSSYIDTSNLQSVRQAIGVSTMRKAINQDAQSVAKIISAIEEITAKTMEMSVTPHKGANIDINA